jgi:hypothetical protein
MAARWGCLLRTSFTSHNAGISVGPGCLTTRQLIIPREKGQSSPETPGDEITVLHEDGLNFLGEKTD